MSLRKRPPERKLNKVTITLTTDEMLALQCEADHLHAASIESAAAAMCMLGVTTNGFRRLRARRSAEERQGAARLHALQPPVDLGPADRESDGSQVPGVA